MFPYSIDNYEIQDIPLLVRIEEEHIILIYIDRLENTVEIYDPLGTQDYLPSLHSIAPADGLFARIDYLLKKAAGVLSEQLQKNYRVIYKIRRPLQEEATYQTVDWCAYLLSLRLKNPNLDFESVDATQMQQNVNLYRSTIQHSLQEAYTTQLAIEKQQEPIQIANTTEVGLYAGSNQALLDREKWNSLRKYSVYGPPSQQPQPEIKTAHFNQQWILTAKNYTLPKGSAIDETQVLLLKYYLEWKYSHLSTHIRVDTIESLQEYAATENLSCDVASFVLLSNQHYMCLYIDRQLQTVECYDTRSAKDIHKNIEKLCTILTAKNGILYTLHYKVWTPLHLIPTVASMWATYFLEKRLQCSPYLSRCSSEDACILINCQRLYLQEIFQKMTHAQYDREETEIRDYLQHAPDLETARLQRKKEFYHITPKERWHRILETFPFSCSSPSMRVAKKS